MTTIPQTTTLTQEKPKTREDYIRDAEDSRDKAHSIKDDFRAQFWQMDALLSATLAQSAPPAASPAQQTDEPTDGQSDENEHAAALLVALVNELQFVYRDAANSALLSCAYPDLDVAFRHAEAFVERMSETEPRFHTAPLMGNGVPPTIDPTTAELCDALAKTTVELANRLTRETRMRGMIEKLMRGQGKDLDEWLSLCDEAKSLMAERGN